MRLLYEETLGGISIRRCYGLDGIVEIPGMIEGKPVRELAGYVLSEIVRGREEPPDTYEGEQELCGTQVEELMLPDSVGKIGPYAFYNCFHLKKVSCSSRTLDWGAGVFTGCTGVEWLDIRVDEKRKSCFKDILSELRQTVVADYRDERGKLLARLVFPEFFEDSVENTPARFIMREMHGCGHMYRYCFDETRFLFGEYDLLFPQVQIQEKPKLAAALALYRLYWPRGLSEAAGKEYWSYIEAHAGEAARGLLERGEKEILRWLARSHYMGEEAVDGMIREAARAEDAEGAALLMDIKHSRFGQGARICRTFEL